MNTIFHIDFDSFFASCEQHFNPNLRGKPIGVTAENGRNAIIAASREAKKLGVRSPNNTWEAKRICPEIIFVKADFERYLEITKKFLQIANTFSPTVELFSLDEVFIDMTDVMNLYQNNHPETILGPQDIRKTWNDNTNAILNIVQDFKNKLREQVGPTITASIGVSYNKILAKLATSINKPDGFAVIDRENKDKVFAQLELTDIMGIGERFKRRLNMLGVFTFKELEEFPIHLLRAEFGKVASENLKRLAMGVDDTPVVSYLEETKAKSVGRNYCLPKNEYNQEVILKNIYELSEEIGIKLRRLNLKAKTIGLYLTGEQSMGGRKTYSRFIDTGQDIFEACARLYREWNWNFMVRQMSVWAGNLVDQQYTTIPLFENPQKDVVIQVIDRINERFGHHTIRNGYLTYAPKLHTKPNGYGADRAMREDLRSA